MKCLSRLSHLANKYFEHRMYKHGVRLELVHLFSTGSAVYLLLQGIIYNERNQQLSLAPPLKSLHYHPQPIHFLCFKIRSEGSLANVNTHTKMTHSEYKPPPRQLALQGVFTFKRIILYFVIYSLCFRCSFKMYFKTFLCSKNKFNVQAFVIFPVETLCVLSLHKLSAVCCCCCSNWITCYHTGSFVYFNILYLTYFYFNRILYSFNLPCCTTC